EARRAWTRRTADFLASHYRPGDGIFTTFGDVTGAVAAAGIPLRETLTWDNGPYWSGATTRPEIFLRDQWALAIAGDPVQSTIQRAARRGPTYVLQEKVIVKGAPVIEIYRRAGPEGILPAHKEVTP
ncbi:MAG: hypothetical protein ACRD96_13715, partial [Bryobacteraceae bacterium]